MQTNRENPIVKLCNRNTEEFNSLLRNTNFKEIKNNEFTEKYRIYINKYENINNLINNTSKMVDGYIIDYFMKIYSSNGLNKQKFNFLFLGVDKNFYILNFQNFSSVFLSTNESEKNSLFDKINIEKTKNLNVYFDSSIYFSNLNSVFSKNLLEDIKYDICFLTENKKENILNTINIKLLN